MSTHITQMATVVVPVADQERAIAFFVDKVGFEKVADFRYADDARWVEVAPCADATRISLAVGRPVGIETGVAFVSEDIEADHAALRARGVDLDEAILREGDPVVRWSGIALAGIPAMFRFRDPDGNSFLIVQAL